MKRLSFYIFLAVGLFCVSGNSGIFTFAAPPVASELRYYPYQQYQSIYQPTYIVPLGQTVHAANGITHPLAATEAEPNNDEYIIAQQPIVQPNINKRTQIVRSRSGRYYTTTPIISESYDTESVPILAPPIPNSEPITPPQITQSQQIPTQSPFSPPNTNQTTTTVTTQKNIIENTPVQLDFLNARLAKMQLEKKDLEGTLRSIQKIDNTAFQVQTIVDLAEYVSRDKNYRKEAEHLFTLALSATDAFAKKQPVIITFPNSTSGTATRDKTSTKTNKTTRTSKTPTAETPSKNNTITESTPSATNTDDVENYLIDPPVDTKPKTPRTKNITPKLELNDPDLKDDKQDNIDLDKNNSDLTDKNVKPILPETKSTDITTRERNKGKKKIEEIVPDDLEAESLLLEQSTKQRERKSLQREGSSLLNPDNNNTTTEGKMIQPPIINQVSPDGKKIPLAPPTKMTMEEYFELNKNNIKSKPTEPKATESKPTEKSSDTDKQLEEDKDTTDLLTPPQTENKPKPKNKPTRPLRKKPELIAN
jgi:hypothetical protein